MRRNAYKDFKPGDWVQLAMPCGVIKHIAYGMQYKVLTISPQNSFIPPCRFTTLAEDGTERSFSMKHFKKVGA